MPEEIEIETKELQETLEELHHEREERDEEKKRESWMGYIALSTALMAVIAAIGALQSGSLVNEALIERHDAGIAQAQASDQWAYYQAKGIKSAVSGGVAEINVSLGKPSGHWAADRDRYKKEQAQIMEEAKQFEEKRDEANDKSDVLLASHHMFAYSVTLMQVAIALSAIAALTRKRAVWYLSMLAGLAGAILFVIGFSSHPALKDALKPDTTEHSAPEKSSAGGGAATEKGAGSGTRPKAGGHAAGGEGPAPAGHGAHAAPTSKDSGGE